MFMTSSTDNTATEALWSKKQSINLSRIGLLSSLHPPPFVAKPLIEVRRFWQKNCNHFWLEYEGTVAPSWCKICPSPPHRNIEYMSDESDNDYDDYEEEWY